MKKKNAQHSVVGIFLAAAMLMSGFGLIVASALSNGEASGSYQTANDIIYLNPLSAGLSAVSVEKGTKAEALPLPIILTGTTTALAAGENTMPAVNENAEIPVASWNSQPAYSQDTPGVYVFMPVFSSEYTIRAGLALPTVTVTVNEGTAEASSAPSFEASQSPEASEEPSPSPEASQSLNASAEPSPSSSPALGTILSFEPVNGEETGLFLCPEPTWRI